MGIETTAGSGGGGMACKRTSGGGGGGAACGYKTKAAANDPFERLVIFGGLRAASCRDSSFEATGGSLGILAWSSMFFGGP